MAIYFLNIKTFGRSTGSSAPAAAAYRAGERIRDERTGRIYDHSQRSDVLHKEILLPSKLAADDVGWAKDRSVLWNTAESAETRGNARVAREYLVALPVELSAVERLRLAQGFSRELTERYGFALDLTVHAPRTFPGSDARNFHAHLLATTRQAGIEGLGPKTVLEMNDAVRRSMGLGPVIEELVFARERWATMSNEALREASVAARVDHRSLAMQGIDREPLPRIPRAAFEMERHGYRSVVAERMREEFEERARERLQRAAEPAASRKPQSLEEIRREARENWLRMRSGLDPEPSRGPSPEKIDDLSREPGT
ncbi:MAG TPA: MobA/MobL family protein [Steroidobacteraceae bacterium]|jgi:ATP-dependent exoDNAse (exonuclease V) alpha subunit|nr:MobA/MobL family protein [Steroidobacteraceae bacterium]